MTERSVLRAKRRQQIVTAARRLIAEQGLEALTFKALERRLDFSRGVMTYHFNNKDEILEAILTSAVEEINERTRDKVVKGETMAEKLIAMLHSVVNGFLERPEAGIILISFWSRIPSTPRIARVNANLYKAWRHYSAELVRRGQAIGEFREVNVEATAAHLVGVVIGLVTQIYFDSKSFNVEEATLEAGRTVLARLQIA